VQRAVELLKRGRPAADVAAACGFCDQSHMSRTFRRFLGVSPSRYIAS
jgi:AraC-like DNA-binding protein